MLLWFQKKKKNQDVLLLENNQLLGFNSVSALFSHNSTPPRVLLTGTVYKSTIACINFLIS